tara:strand:- start:178 stop:789 length:612 start_codon:yes stop_codon:yes gene_type:complete
MWVREKFYRLSLIKKKLFLFHIFFIYSLSITVVFADLQKNLTNKLALTKTLSFNFKQKIAEKEEVGNCFIKYPLLMKCNYQNLKQKTLISNGKTVAIIKKKYKKIYYYPIKTTPLFTILNKEKILNLIRNNKPTKIDSNIIEFEFIDKKSNKLKILFDKNTLELKGWETKDAYSNNVSFIISNLIINNQIVDDFFKIPQEKDL